MNASHRALNAASPVRNLFIISFVVLLSLALLPETLGFVDLVTPVDNALLNNQNVTFEYYPSLAGVITSCTLAVDSQAFPDTTITNNAFNTFTVVNLAEGWHAWRITCQNSATSDYSVTRSFILDRTAPALTITTPAEGATTTTQAVTILATDDRSATMACTANVNGAPHASFNAQNNTATTFTTSLDASGEYALAVTCRDEAGNARTVQRNYRLELPPPVLSLNIVTDKASYALGEQVRLTVNATAGAAVNLEVCPDTGGFVQCYTPIVTGTYPQVLTLPYANKTGEYLVEAIALLGDQTLTRSTRYAVTNTMAAIIVADRTPALNTAVTYTAAASGAVGTVTYRWRLSNGTLVNGKTLTRTYTTIGTFTETVTATDANNNQANATYTAVVNPEYLVTIKVIDTAGTAVPDATVQAQLQRAPATSTTKTTGADGKALFNLLHDTYKLFVSKTGYSYYLNETEITKEATLTIVLDQNDNGKPVIAIASPADGADVTLPVTIAYTVADSSTVSCTLSYAKAGDAWMAQAGTQSVSSTASQTFTLTNLQEARYTYAIECVDASENQASTPQRSFNVKQGSLAAAQQTSVIDEASLDPSVTALPDDPLAVIDRAYGAYDSFTAQQREIADLLGWETLIKEAKKALERQARDLNAIDFRRDLNDVEKARERVKLQEQINALITSVPVDLALLDSTTGSRYLTAEELETLAPDIVARKGYSFTTAQAVKYLFAVQQDYTIETKLVRAKIILSDGTGQPIGVVSHRFTYKAGTTRTAMTGSGTPGTASANGDPLEFSEGGLTGTYTLYETLPSSIATKEAELFTGAERKLLGEKPLALEFAPASKITYYVKKDVTLADLQDVKTVLLKKPTLEDVNALTGASFRTITSKIDWKTSLFLTIALLLAFLLFRKAALLHRLKYVLYALSGKKPVHAVKLLVNDGLARLEAGDLETSMMRYKEAKLSYERLDEYGKNDAYDDLAGLRQALDERYFTVLVDRINEALHAGDLERAIDDYARLEGTYEHLEPEDQNRLYGIVLELGKRLGLEEPSLSGGGAS